MTHHERFARAGRIAEERRHGHRCMHSVRLLQRQRPRRGRLLRTRAAPSARNGFIERVNVRKAAAAEAAAMADAAAASAAAAVEAGGKDGAREALWTSSSIDFCSSWGACLCSELCG